MARGFLQRGGDTVPHYIQLLTLTPEGRARVLEDSQVILREQTRTHVDGVEVLGSYAVLGSYDFVNIVQAPDNEAIARFSLDLGVRLGAHITTLPAIPISHLEPAEFDGVPDLERAIELSPEVPDEPVGRGPAA